MARKRKVNEIVESDGKDQFFDSASPAVAQLKSEVISLAVVSASTNAVLVPSLPSDANAVSTTLAQPTIKDQPEDAVDWMARTVAQLKSELFTRSLSLTGRKAELVARLAAHNSGKIVEYALRNKRSRKFSNVATSSAGPERIAPPDSAAQASKSKAQTSNPPKDVDIEGPLAVDMVLHKHMNHETGERRLRDFVPAPDDKFKSTFWRILNERMFMLDRRMSLDRKGHACQDFDIAGSTGNIYTVTIGRSPKCSCMDARIRGQKCKHINYALIVILKAPTYLQYQLAFLSDELESIFANAPVTRALDEYNHDDDADAESLNDGIRKPIEGECPICVFPMEHREEELVWCKAACGQNFHTECFEQWKRSKRGGRVTCVYCRIEWQEAGPKKGSLAYLSSTAPIVGSYRNIGHHQMYRVEQEEEA